MSNELEPWKKRIIKKGRIHRHLLQSGPASIDSILVIAKIDNPNATRDDVENILSSTPHKFYKTEDGKWGAFQEEAKVYYRPYYSGPFRNPKKAIHYDQFESVDFPKAPQNRRFEVGADGVPSIIIMGDELMMTGTPRLLIEFKPSELIISKIFNDAFEENIPIRFFLKNELGSYFIGTRNILSVRYTKSGYFRVVASPASDDTLRFLAPAKEQILLLQQNVQASQLPALSDGSIILPYKKVSQLTDIERKSFLSPCNEKIADFSVIKKEFRSLQYKLQSDPEKWSKIKKFLEIKKPLIDKMSWQKLLLMLLYSPNAQPLDLLEILHIYLAEEPEPLFALDILKYFSRFRDPGAKIASLLEEYAEIAIKHEPLKYEDFLVIARVFYNSPNKRYDDAAKYYQFSLEENGSLEFEDLKDAIMSFLHATLLSKENRKAFIDKSNSLLFEESDSLPDAPSEDFIKSLFNFSELVSKYAPGRQVEVADKILGYLTAVQKDDYAKSFYEEYAVDFPKFADRINLISSFENCESLNTLQWLMDILYDELQKSVDKLSIDKINIAIEQLKRAERLAGFEPLYSDSFKEILEKLQLSRTGKEVISQEKFSLSDLGLGIVAIIGGNNIYHKRMEDELKMLGASRVIHIQPTFDANLDQSTLKEKLKNANLALHVTTYSKHKEHFMLNNLKNTPEFSNKKIISVNGGLSRSIREMKEALNLP